LQHYSASINNYCCPLKRQKARLMLLPLQGATAPTRDTQGVASLALGYVLHWAFSPPLLNPKLQALITRLPVEPLL